MKNYFFFVDDNIWFCRDLSRQGGNSLFDNEYLKIFKDMHDKYGAKVQLNLFYQTDTGDFNLSQMTDRYKSEWRENSDWLKLAFHARAEFPDYPYINSDYEEASRDFGDVKKEIIRFAGEECMSYDIVTHWLSVSAQACKAFRDAGGITLDASGGDCPSNDDAISLLSEKHRRRLMQNREQSPDTYPFGRVMGGGEIMPFIKSYNHFTKETADSLAGTKNFYFDEKTSLYFKMFSDLTLNMYEPNRIIEILDGFGEREFIGILIHEQYFYKDYNSYQPNYREKIETAIKYLHNKGYSSVFGRELL